MRVVGCLMFVAMGALPSACLEMPVYQVSKADNPMVQRDAGDSGLDPVEERCRACIAAPEDAGPGCKTPYDVCSANGMCKVMIECAFSEGCFLGPSRDFLTCALPCLDKAGVDRMNAVILETASNLFQCFANGPCRGSCFVE
jgi:hypothetical protein